MLQEVAQYRDMTTTFGGYNHQISCGEGQFFDMKNMTSQYFPILSPRQNRGMVKQFVNPQGILDKEDLMWIDDNKFYINGEIKATLPSPSDSLRTMVKMGAYVVIMPDKIWYNADKNDYGYIEASYTKKSGVSFNLCEANGTGINYKTEEEWGGSPQDGGYMMSTKNGKPSLKVYSSNTKTWLTVATTYVQINAKGIGKDFNKGDGVKITINKNYESLSYIFVNKEDGGKRSTNTYIVDKDDDGIIIPGIFKASSTTNLSDLEITVERKMPDMAYITECNNRLWGCSKDGHEIYCCKLGDVMNWNCFQGISTDSWAATIGSDGKFTGATTYLGYPMFFKEDGLIKVSVSATGGHQIKETKCRGVQKGSEGSLVVLNETLYYKSSTCVCGYNGSLPYSISDELGEVRYTDAIGGTIGDRYYISMKASDGTYNMFVYDSRNGIWCKEDDTQVLYFCRHMDDLYYIDAKDKIMKSTKGTLLYDVSEKSIEDKFEWFAESGTIGYSSPDNKYVSRINIRITLEFGTNVDFYMQYDSSGEWEHKFNMSGKGTKTFTLPIIPRRCDHFKYKIKGKGECKIHSITKTMEDGSDI
jgi:hypothetical protein